MLLRGAKLNKKDYKGNSALSTTLLYKDITIAKFLLNTKNISINTINKIGRILLIYIARKRDIKIIKLLIKRKAQINAYDNNCRTLLLYIAK